jgi:nucleotide-binding universal stress UspA family protein
MRLFRSILVPLDGSSFAEQAVPFAIDLARRAGALLQVVMVYEPLPVWAMSLEVPQIDPAFDREARQRSKAYLDGIVARLKAEANVPVSGAVLEGPVASTIGEHVRDTAADLVVMTTHGRGPLTRFWVGSVADRLMRTLTVPLLLIRPREGATTAGTTIRKVMVPLDRSPFGERVLEAAEGFAQLTGASLVLAYVLEPILPILDPVMTPTVPLDGALREQLRQQAEVYLSTRVSRLSKEGIKAEPRVIEAPGAASGLLELAAKEHVDVIAMATHGEGGARRLLLGSVADKVVRGSEVPVLVLRPESPEG